MSLTSQIDALAVRIGAEIKAIAADIATATAAAASALTRAGNTPYTIWINTSTRTFGPIPSPRPTPVIVFNATKLLDFNPATEAPTVASHPTLDTGDILEFYYTS